jgi:superoxide dismutase
MYEIKPLPCNPAALDGLSEKLIVSHHENNYGGAVKRLNQIQEHLATVDFAKAPAMGDGIVLLALDMYEHSYHIDYGAKAAGYVDAYMKNINWRDVAQRYERACVRA